MPNGIVDGFFCTVLEWHDIANPHPFSSYMFYIKYDLLTTWEDPLGENLIV